LKPGDLIFYAPGNLHHVSIFIGGGMMVHAPHTGDHVRMAPIDLPGPISAYLRPG
jgi:cell wall-associated NlpC family hydrolase